MTFKCNLSLFINEDEGGREKKVSFIFIQNYYHWTVTMTGSISYFYKKRGN